MLLTRRPGQLFCFLQVANALRVGIGFDFCRPTAGRGLPGATPFFAGSTDLRVAAEARHFILSVVKAEGQGCYRRNASILEERKNHPLRESLHKSRADSASSEVLSLRRRGRTSAHGRWLVLGQTSRRNFADALERMLTCRFGASSSESGPKEVGSFSHPSCQSSASPTA